MSRRSQIAANPGLQESTERATHPIPPPAGNPTVEGVPSPRRHHFYRAQRVADQETIAANERRIAELEAELNTRRAQAAQHEEETHAERQHASEELQSRAHRGREEHAGGPGEVHGDTSVSGSGPGRGREDDHGQRREEQEPAQQVGLLVCPECGQACKNKAGLSAHKRYKHPPQQ